MSVHTSPPLKNQSRELIIQVRDGQPLVLLPIATSDEEYRSVVRLVWALVKSGRLLSALEALQN